METNTALDWVIDLPEQDFKELVSQSMKARTREPEKWQLLLDPAVIGATRDVIEEFIDDAEQQMSDPARYPHARHFHRRMRGFLVDLEFTDRLRGEG